MDEVIQHPGAEDRIARVVDPGLVIRGHLPVVVPFSRIEVGKNLFCFLRVGVKRRQNSPVRLHGIAEGSYPDLAAENLTIG